MMLPVAALGLCAFQFGDDRGLNSMPFTEVQPLVLDLGKAQKLANEGNLELLSGRTIRGEEALVRGELTDANCYLGSHTHAYDHAFCAKLCVAAGAPLVFVPDHGQQIYVLMNERNGIRIPENVLNEIGVPEIVINRAASFKSRSRTSSVVSSNAVSGKLSPDCHLPRSYLESTIRVSVATQL